jgi:hypothetical protein
MGKEAQRGLLLKKLCDVRPRNLSCLNLAHVEGMRLGKPADDREEFVACHFFLFFIGGSKPSTPYWIWSRL